MANNPRSRKRFPTVSIAHSRRKPTVDQLGRIADIIDAPQSLLDFLHFVNGGVPQQSHFDWTTARGGKRTSRIDRLFGFDCDNSPQSIHHGLDITWAILKFRHWLPRWSIPLGFVDDYWFLITFSLYDAREGQVWLKEWCHDVPDDHLHPDKKIHHVAHSLPDFVHTWYSVDGEVRLFTEKRWFWSTNDNQLG